ncbi:MAG: hypothetical protein O9262_09865 [Cyclobacteriaceae bacterium]|nr:hypothetical protein [Cyclobacteriaceae bacterium]
MGINIRNAFYASPNKGVDITTVCVGIVNKGQTQIVVLPEKLGIPDPDLGVRKMHF